MLQERQVHIDILIKNPASYKKLEDQNVVEILFQFKDAGANMELLKYVSGFRYFVTNIICDYCEYESPMSLLYSNILNICKYKSGRSYILENWEIISIVIGSSSNIQEEVMCDNNTSAFICWYLEMISIIIKYDDSRAKIEFPDDTEVTEICNNILYIANMDKVTLDYIL